MGSRRFRIILSLLALVSLVAVAPASAVTSIGVVGAAALQGSFGMRVTYDGAGGAAYVQDNSPNAEAVYFALFRIRPDSVTMTNLNGHQVLQAFVNDAGTGTPAFAFRVNLFRNAVGAAQPWAIHVFPRKDDNTFYTPRLAVNLNASPQQVGIEFRAGTGTGNGIMRVYRDGSMRKEELNIDNDTLRVGMVRFGAPAAPDSSALGFLDLDDFVSTRTCPGIACP
jgi:hypothetical protein